MSVFNAKVKLDKLVCGYVLIVVLMHREIS